MESLFFSSRVAESQKRFKPESYRGPYPRDVPSNALFVKNLRYDVDEQKMVDMVRPFQPTKVVVFFFKGRALIEFADESSCVNAMNFLNNSAGLGEGGGKVTAERSNTGPIREGQGLPVGPDGTVLRDGNQRMLNQRIVKICCKGSLYPVNAAAIFAAVSPYGAPVKIATYKSFDEAVNALIEFETETEAANVVKSLDGQCLYAGRVGLMKCSLSHQAEVIIKENNPERNWDRAAGMGPPQGHPSKTPVPYQPVAAPIYGGYQQYPQASSSHHALQQQQQQLQQQQHQMQQQTGVYGYVPGVGATLPAPGIGGNNAVGGAMGAGYQPADGHGAAGLQTCVTVTNADWSKTKLDHIFNLFGYFGNVARIKLIQQKNLCVVDYATPEEAQNAFRFIKNGLVLFGQQLHVCFSKYPTLNIPGGSYSDTVRDYTQLPRLHRYPQGIASDRVRWISAPTARLHVILTGRAPAVLEQDLRPLFERIGPVQSFATENNNKADGVKVAMALVDMATPEDATNVLATWHNHELQNGSKLFLSFTNKRQR